MVANHFITALKPLFLSIKGANPSLDKLAFPRSFAICSLPTFKGDFNFTSKTRVSEQACNNVVTAFVVPLCMQVLVLFDAGLKQQLFIWFSFSFVSVI